MYGYNGYLAFFLSGIWPGTENGGEYPFIQKFGYLAKSSAKSSYSEATYYFWKKVITHLFILIKRNNDEVEGVNIRIFLPTTTLKSPPPTPTPALFPIRIRIPIVNTVFWYALSKNKVLHTYSLDSKIALNVIAITVKIRKF